MMPHQSILEAVTAYLQSAFLDAQVRHFHPDGANHATLKAGQESLRAR